MVSGGADSACLAAGLAAGARPRGRPRPARQLRAARLGAGDGTSSSAATSARRLRIDLHVERPAARGDGNLQAAARELRYAPPSGCGRAPAATWIATGHTRTDLAETVLYRLAASPGARALRGLRAAQRPRGPAAAGARARRDAAPRRRAPSLPFADDETNLDLDFARNRIRAEVLPVLRELSPAGRAQHRRDPGRAGRGGPAAGAGRARGARRPPAPAPARWRSGPTRSPGSEPALRRLALRALAERAAGRAVRARAPARGRDRAAGRRVPRAGRSSSAAACARSASTG